MTLTLLSALVLSASVIAPPHAAAPDPVQEANPLQGTWIFNREASDDPMKAMSQAQSGMRVRPNQGPDMTEQDMQAAMEIVRGEMRVSPTLILGVQGGWITMTTGDGGILMVPGTGDEVRAVIRGVPYELEAELKSDRISIKREWERLRFIDEFKVEDDGERLVLRRSFRGGPMAEFVVKFVFDREG